MKHILEFDSVRLSFGDRVILSDVYMRCETGQITGLLGRNGQGKSCLFKIVYGELAAEERSVRFDRRPVAEAYLHPELLRFLPQFNFVPDGLTVARVFEDFGVDFLAFGKRFPEFESKHRVKVRDLSGGQARFVQTYVILKSSTQFVILDEPFTHLMPLQIERIVEVMQEEKHDKGLLITDHLFRTVVALADDLYLLTNGKTHRVWDEEDIEVLGYAHL